MSITTLGRVLVVDDEVQLTEALVEALTTQGYAATGFLTGEPALKALQTQEFDLLLTDLMMPGMDGITLLKAGLALDPNLVGIIMTGQGTVPTAVEAMKSGAFDYVLKPFRMESILPVLARAREVRRLRLENIQLRETVAIYNLSQTIAFSLDSKLVLENTADAALQQTEADEVSIMLLVPERRELYIAAVRGKNREHLLGQRVSLEDGVAGWVARQSEPLILNGEVSDPRFSPVRPRTEIQSAISIPMLAAGKLVGVLNVNSLQPRRAFMPGQIKALSILTSTAAAALENESVHNALRASEGRFRRLAENAPDLIYRYRFTPNRGFEYVSPSVTAMTGYSPEEHYADPDLRIKLVHPDDRLLLETAAHGEADLRRPLILRWIRKDGTHIWVEQRNIPISDSNGNLIAIEGIARDITERKLSDEALAASELRYRSLFESNPHPMWVYDLETLQFLAVNDAAVEHYGYSRDEFLSMTIKEIRPAEDVTLLLEDLAEDQRDLHLPTPWRHLKQDGSLIDVEITSHSVQWRDRLARLVLANDITKRKQAEQALQKSEAQYRNLVEQIPAITYITTLDDFSRATYISPQISALGFAPEEWVSGLWVKQLHPDDRDRVLEVVHQSQAMISSFESEYRLLARDGQVRWYHDQAAIIRDANGQPLFLQGFLLDITERRHAEEKLRLSDQILQRVNALVLVADSNGNMTYISPSARTILGYEPDELLGENWWKASRGEAAEAQREKQYIRQAARREIPIPAEAYERPIQDRWGNTHWISWIDAAGPNDTLIGLGHDVTERKLAEERLIESERDLAEAQRVAKIGSWRFDSRTNIVRWSEEVYRIFGLQKEAFGESHNAFLGFVHRDDRSLVEQIDQQTLITGKPFNIEYRIITPGGEQKTISEVGYPVIDSDHKIIGLFGTAQDITERKQSEEALREAEAKYRMLVERIPAITYIAAADASSSTLYASPQVTRMLGFSQEELTDGTDLWARQIHPDDRARVLSELENSRASGKPFSAEYRIYTRDGSLVWAYDTADFVRDASNQPRFLQGVMLDITDRKHLEAQLQQNEATLRGFYESAPSLMGITELVGEDDILHVYDNPATCRFFGAEKDATNGRLSSELGAPLSARRAWIERYRESEQSGLPVHFEYLHQDGEHPRWLAVTVAVILEESSPRTRFCYVAEDITERKQAEEKVMLQANLLGAVGSAAIATDLAGRVIYWNPAAEQLYGWSSSEALGKSITDLTPAEQSQEQAQKIMQRLRAGKSWSGEFMVKRKDGSLFPAFISNSPFLDSNEKMIGIIGVSNDISELKQVQLALQEKEHLLSEAQRIGHIGSWRYDIIRDTLQYSEEMYHLLDVSREGFGHDSAAFLDAVYASDRPMFAKWMEDIKVRGQCKEIEFLVFHKNGELHYIRCRGAVEFDKAGKPSSFIGTAQDVTERKLAEIQIRQQIERLTALRKVDQAISSSFDLKVTLEVLLSQLASQLHVDAADVLLLDAGRQLFSYAAGRGFRTSALELTPLRQAESQALRERRPIHVQSLKNKPDPRLLTLPGASEGFECYFGVPLLVKGKIQGLLEVFHRTPLQPYPEWLDFLNTMAGQAAIAIENTTLFENLERSNLELSQAYDATIEGWSRALDLRDKETEGHTQRVTEMTLALARKFGLPEEQLLYIRWGALLHDIGKMGVPDHILLKHGALTAEEWMIMRSHAQYAYELLKPIHFLTPALDIPYCHHEKWDGTGYPRGLKGEEIPLAARLFAVVDVWDALRSDRPYRPAWTVEETKEYICAESGRHFDPRVVESFLKILL